MDTIWISLNDSWVARWDQLQEMMRLTCTMLVRTRITGKNAQLSRWYYSRVLGSILRDMDLALAERGFGRAWYRDPLGGEAGELEYELHRRLPVLKRALRGCQDSI